MAPRFVLTVVAAILLAITFTRAADINVVLDRDLIIAVPDRIATIVIGNPLIADVKLIPPNHLVITGKSYGATNLIALDRGAAVLVEHNVVVVGSRDVTGVYRGTQRESYSCSPLCEPLATPGDSAGHFEGALTGGGGGGGPCNVASDTARDGSRCGGRAARERTGGRP